MEWGIKISKEKFGKKENFDYFCNELNENLTTQSGPQGLKGRLMT